MTQYLPPNLLALFAPRDPMPFLPPLDKLPVEKKLPPYGGVAQYLNEFEDPKDTPPPTRVENREERKERKRKERAEQVAYKLEQDLALWDPLNDPNATSDPYKSLFVGRINYDTSESKLRRELEAYGPVKKIRIVSDTKSSRPRGYAFVEYEHERDMHSAYKHADGKKIDGRRVLVDIERGRTIKGWRPRRLGGGLGGTRRGGPDVNTKFSGRDDGFGAGREDRERSRSRERGRRDRGRSRSRSRDRPRRRSRSPRERRRRSRSKGQVERGDRVDRADKEKTTYGDAGEREEKRRRRSRSRDRSRRSRSRDRKRRRSRSPRESRKRSRSRDRAEPRPEEPAIDHGAGDMMAGEDFDGFQIKQEPIDTQQGYADGDFNTYNQPPPPENGNQGYNFNEYGTGEEGEAQ